jgi:hypothetical protein
MTAETHTPFAWEIREVRNFLLADTDHIVLINAEAGTDVPQNWVDYRQALRDITNQAGFPSDPNGKVSSDLTWPTKPE